MEHDTHARPRLIWLDHARGVAIIAMVVFHFTFDLMYFGLIAPGTVYRPEWRMFESAIAASFLAIAGLSFMLAHGDALRLRSLKKKLLILAVAAAGISGVTYVIFGANMIRFGILHTILVMTVAAILLRRLHWAVLIGAAVAIVALFVFLPSEVPGPAAAQWVIRTTETQFAVDYRPLIPWAAPFLLGMAVKPFIKPSRQNQDGLPWLTWLGQKSLTIYLLHQPILFGMFFIYTWA